MAVSLGLDMNCLALATISRFQPPWRGIGQTLELIIRCHDAAGESTSETEGTESEDGNDDSLKYVKNWEERTISVTDSPLGGAFIEAIFSDPALIQCVQFIVPPRLKAKFPQAARLQFSMDNGVSWKTAQALEPIGQEELLVKTITGHATEEELETRFDKIEPAAPPAKKGSKKEKIAEAVAAAMQSAKDAAQKGEGAKPQSKP
jgi:hypothetical protein